MSKKIGYGLLLSVVLFVSGCMEYSPPAPGTNAARLIIQKRVFSSKPSLNIEPNVWIDDHPLKGQKKVRLSRGKHTFMTMASPTYSNKNKFYSAAETFSLNIKANAKYVFYYRADRKIPKKGKTPNVYVSVRENGKLILSRKIKTVGSAVAEARGQELMVNIIMSALIF